MSYSSEIIDGNKTHRVIDTLACMSYSSEIIDGNKTSKLVYHILKI